jgi:RNA recognition motif-containing protein
MAESTKTNVAEAAPAPGTELYIGNLAWATTPEELTKSFSEFGELSNARIVMSARTGQSKGFGFVTFKDKDCAAKALEAMDEKDYGGRPLNVKLARDRSSASADKPTGPEKLCVDRLHFGNLPKDFSTQDLEAKCAVYGECSNVEVLSRRNHSFGYATFESPAVAQKALEGLDASDIGGDEIKVVFARQKDERRKPKQDKKRQPRNRTAKTPAVQRDDDAPAKEVPTQLFIRNLSWDTTDETLQAFFQPFGELEEVSVIKNRTGRSRGFGFVSFKSEESCKNALEKGQGSTIDDREITLAPAKERQARAPKSNNNTASSKIDEEAPDYSDCVWVGGLPASVEISAVTALFEDSGFEVVETTPGHKKRGQFFCYVTVDSSDTALSAVEKLDQTAFGSGDDAATLSVQVRKPRAAKKPKKRRKPRRRVPKVIEYYDNELYVGNIPADMTDVELATLFKPYGAVAEAQVKGPGRSKKGKIFGFVTFDGADGAAAALAEQDKLNSEGGYDLDLKYSRVPKSQLSAGDEGKVDGEEVVEEESLRVMEES